MRNIFDQYSQAENRLTHALLISLSEDRTLLSSFLRDLCGLPCANPRTLEVMGQRLPGQPEPSEDEAERRGLPDICILDGDKRCILVEAKVETDFTAGQVARHRRTLERIGYETVTVIGITGRRVPKKTEGLHRTLGWQDIYSWLAARRGKGSWADRAASFMEVCEERMIGSGQLRDAALTKFSGVPFSREHPYSYREARRLIGLIMEDLRADAKLMRTLGMNPKIPGRPAITGSDDNRVWDFLSLASSEAENFTSTPHLTLGLHDNELLAMVTVPNSVKGNVKRNLRVLGEDGFRDVVEAVTNEMVHISGWTEYVKPWFIGMQRHYKSQRAIPVVDATIQFDLRTAVRKLGRRGSTAIKSQGRWLSAAYGAFVDKGDANYQIQIGARIPYATCDLVRKPECVGLIRDVWLSCAPFVRVAVASPRKPNNG